MSEPFKESKRDIDERVQKQTQAPQSIITELHPLILVVDVFGTVMSAFSDDNSAS